MVQSGDHLQMKVFQSLAGFSQEILNVYYFEVLSITATQPLANIAESLKDWVFGEFLEPQRYVQTVTLSFNRVEFNNLSDFETDFTIVTPEVPMGGLVNSEFQAPQAAWSFQLVRTTRLTRHGSKRLSGVPESLTENGKASAAALTYLATIAEVIDNPPTVDLDLAGTMSMRSVIPKTPVYPATLPTIFNPVASVQYRGIGSQNSRKQLL